MKRPAGPPDPRDERGVAIVAVGDLQLGDSSTCVGYGFRSRYADAHAMSAWASHIRGLLGEADLVFGNLEGVISDAGLVEGDWRSVQLRGRPLYAELIKEAGFTVLNVANNHTFQHGEEAFHDTVRLVEEAGITVVGLRGEAPWTSRPAVMEVGGRTIGLLAYCFRPRQYSEQIPPYAEGDPGSVGADVRRLRDEVDDVVVSLHWGEEFVPIPSSDEVAAARQIVEAGAALIMGHHPHVLRPLHRLGQGVVAYSLGNFTGDMVWHEPLRTGGVLRCRLGAGAPEARIEPVRVGKDFLPRPSGPPRPAIDRVESLSPAAYEQAIRRTIRSQRFDAYRHALLNIHRFPTRILLQLVRTTIGNKLAALRSSSS